MLSASKDGEGRAYTDLARTSGPNGHWLATLMSVHGEGLARLAHDYTAARRLNQQRFAFDSIRGGCDK